MNSSNSITNASMNQSRNNFMKNINRQISPSKFLSPKNRSIENIKQNIGKSPISLYNRKMNLNLLTNDSKFKNEKNQENSEINNITNDVSFANLNDTKISKSPSRSQINENRGQLKNHKMQKLLKNLIETNKQPESTTFIQNILKSRSKSRENSPERNSQRSSRSQYKESAKSIKKESSLTHLKNSKNININNTNNINNITVKQILENRKNESKSKSPNKNETEKKIKNTNNNNNKDELRSTIKDGFNIENIKKNENKAEFSLNLKINIENKVINPKINQRYLNEQQIKKTNLPENLKISENKLKQLVNSQKNNFDKISATQKQFAATFQTPCKENIKIESKIDTSTGFFTNSNSSTCETNNLKNSSKNSLIQTPKINVEKIDNNVLQSMIRLEETLIEIINTFKANHKIINICKTYLQIVAEGTLEILENIFDNDEEQKTLKTMIILERMAIIIVISLSFNTHLNPKFINNSINMLQYVHQNFLIIVECIIEKLLINETNQFYLSKLKQLLLMNKTRDTSRVSKQEIIKKTNICIIRIIESIVKQNKSEPFTTIGDLLKNTDQLTVSDATQYLMQCFYSLILELEQQMNDKIENKDELFIDEDLSEQLTYVASPYLPPLDSEKDKNRYTLVLDLDETLVHYEELEDNSGQFLVRPYAEEFLYEMAKHYEIVIFTAALQDYADYILDILDENKSLISYRLYRKHTVHNGSIYVKDLSKIGRDLNKVIIVDNLADNFQNQPENGIFIQSWYGEPDDKALLYLAPLLIEIVNKKYVDVKCALQKFKDQMIENINKGVTDPFLNLTLD